jgi:hypothetical protein
LVISKLGDKLKVSMIEGLIYKFYKLRFPSGL